MITSPSIHLINMALSRIGLERIDSIEEKTKRGRIVKLHYEQVLVELLQSNLWSFAFKKEPLTLLADTCRYHYPYDYVRGVGLACGGDDCCCIAKKHVNFVQMNGGLEIQYAGDCSCCNTHDYLVYISKDTPEQALSPLFRGAFSLLLAARILPAFRQDEAVINNLVREGNNLANQAMAEDAQEAKRVSEKEFRRRQPFFKECDCRYIPDCC